MTANQDHDNDLGASVVDALIADPIIRAMAAEAPAGTDLKAFGFINAAFREYRRRGGQCETHLGAPAEAIRRLHQRP